MSEKTILISGAFNPLHFGHLLLLRDASKYGKVIVALNSDEWVTKNKGYLLFDFETRKSLLEECEYVSKVIPFDDSEGDVVYALFEVRPTYFGNGGSATSLSLPKDEMRVCEYLGIEPVFNLGDVAKDIDNNILVSAQKSIINHANKELDNLENYISGDEK
jgi:cytidyltransferase-like protein